MSTMRIDIMTLFPDTMNAVLHESILGRAAKKGIIEVNCVQIRDYTENKQCQVDDYPYGGGWGCVMMAQPLKSCLDDIMSTAKDRKSRVIYMSPQGKPYDQQTARRLRDEYDHLVLVCGHYEGIDERFIEQCVDEEISIGDFVLTGGEIAAMAVADSVCRLVPGVLSDEECFTGESHWDGVLEYPQYTRPEVWEGRAVPEVLLQGNHAAVDEWRRKKSLERTMDKRPDMFERLELTDKKDIKLVDQIKKERSRMKLTQPIGCRPAVESDIEDIMLIVRQARNYLKKHRVDQWQGEYPTQDIFAADIANGECYAVTYGERLAGFFCLTEAPESGYDKITDGKWHGEGKYCTLHRMAIEARFRGTGLSDMLVDFADETAKAKGAECVRTDTHRKNKAMQKLLKRKGYVYRGNVLVSSEPGHDPARQAFEKKI
ncbi:MAG: tRNA (guanosine(37)-N1)-methyltransferase TrmD [Oscillospiraceae bacterium]|nr:tRNA (guanosine(37)-N1)-methyltransferase TrmD [Oscillospiraceae bacterium]